MSEEEFNWVPIIKIADKVAREIAEKWSVVEADDVKQEIMTHLLEERRILERIQADEDLIRKVCWNAGRRYAAKERAYYDLMDDQYFYTPGEVRLALRSFVYSDEEIGQIIGKKDDLNRCVISDNVITARADASKALGRLTERQREVVTRVFIYGLPPKDANQRRAAYRAVDALTQIMNRNIRTGR